MRHRRSASCLSIVCVSLEPSRCLFHLSGDRVRVRHCRTPHQVLSDLVESEDEHRIWHAWGPVQEPQRPKANGCVQVRCVAQEHRTNGFENQPKIHEEIEHSLVANGVPTRFTDEQIRPLHDHDADKIPSGQTGRHAGSNHINVPTVSSSLVARRRRHRLTCEIISKMPNITYAV